MFRTMYRKTLVSAIPDPKLASTYDIILCYPFLFSNCLASQYLHLDTAYSYTVDVSNDDKEFKIVTLRVKKCFSW